MEHLAIDLGGRESQICVRNSDGKIVEEKRESTRALGRYLKGRAKSRVVVETCAEAFAVADAALASGHEVRVVPASLVKGLGVGSRRIKNDRRDAQVLSEVSSRINLPSVHVPSKQARERKSICGMRESLVQVRTKLINAVRGWLRGQLQRPRTGAPETFAKRVRERMGQVPAHVERLLVSVEQLTEQIREAEKELKALAEADGTCQRLMTVPGVGPVNAVRFAAMVDDVERFPSAHEVESYIGLTPGEDSSSDRKRITSITKAGSSKMRWALIQAAWTAQRCRPGDPMVQWSKQVERRRGKRIAAVALARKMTGILYAIWRDGTTYDAKRGAMAVAQPEVDLSNLVPLAEVRRGRKA